MYYYCEKYNHDCQVGAVVRIVNWLAVENIFPMIPIIETLHTCIKKEDPIKTAYIICKNMRLWHMSIHTIIALSKFFLFKKFNVLVRQKSYSRPIFLS
jgi:hypothetical protein